MPTSIDSFARLGQLFREFRSPQLEPPEIDSFAERLAVTDRAVLSEVQALLEPETGDLDRLFDVAIDDADIEEDED